MTNRRARWLLVALPAVALLVWRARQEAWMTDDALIAFRYVENLAAGHGLVYNTGERVEGFSSPLFLLLLYPFAAAGADLFRVAQVLGIVASVVEVALLVRLTGRATGSLVLAGLAGLLFASDRIAIVWATGGLETAFHGALLFGAFTMALSASEAPDDRRPLIAATVLHALVALSRPEGIAFYGVFLASIAWRERGPGLRRALRALPYFLVPVGAALVARLLYYGEPLANTYAAKVEGVPTLSVGLEYLGAFFGRLGLTHPLHALPWLALLAVSIVILVRRRDAVVREAPAALRTLDQGALYLGAAFAIVAWTGGDYMTDFRMLRPILGILWVTAACAAAVVGHSDLRRAPALAGAIVAALLVSHLVRQAEGSAIARDAPPAADHKEILAVDRERAERFAAALAEVAREGDSLLVDICGFRGYGHTHHTYDATGLVSPDPAGDFYLRDDWNEETGGRERLPGHARWPKVSTMEREGYTFIFPKVQARGPEVPEITERSPRRHRGYPFLHVVVPLTEREHLRFFTTLGPDALRERARRIGHTVCWRDHGGPLECAHPGTLPSE